MMFFSKFFRKHDHSQPVVNESSNLIQESGFRELVEAYRIMRLFDKFEKDYPENRLRKAVSVADYLYKEPWRYEFFEAVRILHLIHKMNQQSSANKNSKLLPSVKYKTNLTLNFPASEIQDLRIEKKDSDENLQKETTILTVNFMGLIGPSGILPRHYTDFLLSHRARYKDNTAHQFFDIFNHRAISLFVEAWEKYRFYIDYERNQSKDTMRYILDLVGMGTTGLQERLIREKQGVADEMLVYYSGLNAQLPHSAVGLAAILQDYFSVNVEVLQFQGCWLQLEPDQYTCIGTNKLFNKLGDSAVIGKCVWNLQTKFRIRIGPVDWKTFVAFLPIGDAFAVLKDFVNWYKPVEKSFDVQLVLRKEEVPVCCLGDEKSARLGWSTWLNRQHYLNDVDDTVLTC